MKRLIQQPPVKPFWALLAVVVLAGAGEAAAQQKIAYVDSEYILGKIPEVATINQKVDRMAQEWQTELDTRKREIDEMFREYQARELLYTNEERKRKREEIVRTEEELERLRVKYFGPEGDLFREQDQQMRPIQERVLAAIEEVALKDGYDYVFDISGDFLFLYKRDQHNLSDQVLEELGIEVDNTARNRSGND